MLPADPATLFGLKMALCLAVFLLAAAWLRRRVARVQGAEGPPPAGASAAQALAHYLGARADAGGFAHERRLYRQTIRLLARELQRLDPAHPEAREALELLGERDQPSGRSRNDLANSQDRTADEQLVTSKIFTMS